MVLRPTPRLADTLPCLLACLATNPRMAQGIADRARLTIGVGLVHTDGGGTVWAVPAQPIITPTAIVDTVGRQHSLTSGFGLVFSANYAPGRYIGFAADVVVMGLGSGNRCRIVPTGSGTFTPDLCGSVESSEYSSSTRIPAGGVMLRPGLQGIVQPYARLIGRFGVVQQSLIQATGTVRTGGGLAVAAIYHDNGGTLTTPFYAAAIGMTTAAGSGWQIRWELRDSYVSLPGITAATSRQGLVPPTTMHGHHLFSFSVGLDTVLARKRGRRY